MMFSWRLFQALPLLLSPQVCLSLESPNFLIIRTDDQSWVATSLEMIAEDIDGGSLKPVLFNSGKGKVQRTNPF